MAKNILGRFFALWAAFVFIITLLPVSVLSWMAGKQKEPATSQSIYKIFVSWMNIFFFLSGVKRIYIGREHFKKGDTYIVVCNHTSFMDVPLTSTGIPGANKTIAKIELSRIPLFGAVYKSGSILVDRKSEESRKKSYLQMKEVLSLGLHMCIYPEGTRNVTAQPLQRFHDGAFKLAVDAKKPVIPAVIFYTNLVLPRHKPFYFWPHKIEMHFLPPFSTDDITAADLKQKVYEAMYEYYIQHKH